MNKPVAGQQLILDRGLPWNDDPWKSRPSPAFNPPLQAAMNVYGELSYHCGYAYTMSIDTNGGLHRRRFSPFGPLSIRPLREWLPKAKHCEVRLLV